MILLDHGHSSLKKYYINRIDIYFQIIPLHTAMAMPSVGKGIFYSQFSSIHRGNMVGVVEVKKVAAVQEGEKRKLSSATSGDDDDEFFHV